MWMLVLYLMEVRFIGGEYGFTGMIAVLPGL
jgi:hypothetical protein